MNRTVLIKKNDNEWAAFYNDRRIAGSVCKACVIKLMKNLTATSTKYNKIVILGKNGEVVKELPTGAANVRNNQVSQQ